MRKLIRSCLPAVTCLLVVLFQAEPAQAESAQAKAERPNIVFFLVDDLGWADLGCYGSEFHETPNIDSLAESGMRFTNGYAACPVCSPTRASIMTGRHPVRVDITDWIPGKRSNPNSSVRFKHIDDRENLALEQVTIAEHLREQADYQTYFLGKWHLGGKGFWPTDQGFDVNVAGFEKGSPPGGYYAPWKNPNLKSKEDGEYLTTRLTDEAVSLIEKSNRDRPFLLFFSYYNVHTPIQPDRRSVEHFRNTAKIRFTGTTPNRNERQAVSRLRQDNPEYASMVGAVDKSVGRVLKTIDDAGIRDETIVVFFSDNGGLCTLAQQEKPQQEKPRQKNARLRKPRLGPTSNLPLRSGKGWLYEGGIREPMIVRAPGVTRPGTESDALVFSTDFFPTLLELGGMPFEPGLHIDGTSIVPALRGESTGPRSLYWHYPHYHGSDWKPGAAIRDGKWKLIEFYETGETELYDLADDIGETKNLAATKPEIVDRLKAKLRQWQLEMGAKMPVDRQ